MAPFPAVLQAQPCLEARQNAYQITLTVTRATTTFTTIMNLGGATNVPPANTPAATTTPSVVVQPTLHPTPGDGSDNSGVVIGAVVGSLVGAFLLMLLIWKCCYDYRSAARLARYYDSDTSSSSSRSSRSTRIRRRGGGAGFGRRNERGHRVELPRHAHTRRDRKHSSGTSSSSRSDSTWMRDRRRRSGWGNGLFRWVTGTTRTSRSVYVKRESVGSGRYGEHRFSVDD